MINIEHQYEVIHWLHADDLEFDLELFSRSLGTFIMLLSSVKFYQIFNILPFCALALIARPRQSRCTVKPIP